jgi:hypothetical protein
VLGEEPLGLKKVPRIVTNLAKKEAIRMANPPQDPKNRSRQALPILGQIGLVQTPETSRLLDLAAF